MSPRASAKNAATTHEPSRPPSPEDAIPLLRALLMLALEQREATQETDRPSTQLLEDAGLDYRQIADLLGKSPDAVRMALSRSRKTPAKRASTRTIK
ncbi:MAG: sigma factor-like helix-turn-helix DNA-binding protein [Aeromicrobium sp.]